MPTYPARFEWSITQESEERAHAASSELPGSLFEGHYPGTPVLAGSLLVDAVRQAAEQWLATPLVLCSLLSARFYAPVLPGDRMRAELQRTGEGGSIIHARVSTARGEAAIVQASLASALPADAPAQPAPAVGVESCALDQRALRVLLPHRYPMLLIDHAYVTQSGNDVRLVARKAVTVNEPCYAQAPEGLADWHYPEAWVMESFCQACGVLRASVGKAPGDDRVPVLARIVRFRFVRSVLPGAVLEHHVHIEASTADGALFQGGTWVDGEQVAAVDRIVAALAPRF